jgi:hypothetical protein
MNLRSKVREPRLVALAALLLLGSCKLSSRNLGDESQAGSGSGDGGSGDSATTTPGDDGTHDTGGTGDDGGSGTDGGAGNCGEDDPPPLVYYPFDECSDVTPEAMGTGLDGAMQNADCAEKDDLSNALDASWSSGTALRCLPEPGVYAAAPDDPIFELSEFTISAWVKSPDWMNCGGGGVTSAECSIVSKGNTDNNSGYWLLVTEGELRLDLGTKSEHVHQEVQYGSELSANIWYHVVATFDGNGARLYVNGFPGGAAGTGFAVEYGDEDFLIGGMWNRNFNHNGLIEEVKLWDYAKTADEVADLYSSYVDC